MVDFGHRNYVADLKSHLKPLVDDGGTSGIILRARTLNRLPLAVSTMAYR
jgi:hypothetical protein